MKRSFPLVTSTLRLSSLALAAALAACGGSDEPADPLKPYREQALKWSACDPSITGSRVLEGKALEVAQCAFMRAPMDYDHPERGDVQIALLRVPATEPAQRKGAIVLNPGGPGGDGLGQALALPAAFKESDPANPQGALQLQLLREFDMVGFSPRGVGASTTLTCATNELQRGVNSTAEHRFDPNNIDNEVYNARKSAEACQKNPLTPHIHSVATARDMDLLRGLLGDAKLNYLGYSYGTWLGSVYARLFPDRVGRMVLDSAMDLTDPFTQAWLQQPMARQRLLDDVLIPYAARHPGYFGLGTDVQALRALVPTLPSVLQGMLQESFGSKTYSRDAIDAMVINLAAAKGLAEVLEALPDDVATDDARQALEAHVFVPGNPDADALVRADAMTAFNLLSAEGEPSEPESIRLLPEAAVFVAVSCNDSAWNTDVNHWIGVGNDYIQRYPLFGVGMVPSCAFWGTPPVTPPALSAMQKLDVMMVQSEFDAATATEGAMRGFAALPQAKGVFIAGEYQHAVFPYTDQCVDTTVVKYFLGQTPAARSTQCQGLPYTQDAAVQQASRLQPQSATSGSAYLDPEAARRLIEQFKSGIGRRPATGR